MHGPEQTGTLLRRGGFRRAMTKNKQSQPKPKQPRGRRTGHPTNHKLNQATTDEFEQEGMGVAPKE